ncbi:tRNA (cytidine(34)-2'-O)-methyltransferase [Novosphingopyxis iocasae]|uniref:tRNA (cytidine(34)-2'-O)-methyltransferase n=1 Tax=Novosphingopyxis iocasae TaxID=2762729 RepID=UPI0016510094|nr:tRNA (cytidine(34)-2'-O)-methyltransferase [Novosphingopyxis iocasae]|tara:strand:+ start:463 stop:924 length:462 start_codon:yes stop_codon:yes gene_type:complete
MRIALYQPDIAGNVGTILRLAACFGVPCDVIEPCGFPFSDRALRRAGMDYAAAADWTRHADWSAYHAGQAGSRLVLLSSKASASLYDFPFEPDDRLILGSESAGVPDDVRDACTAAVRIPMEAGFRSLNVAVAAGIALGEALRRTGRFERGAP